MRRDFQSICVFDQGPIAGRLSAGSQFVACCVFCFKQKATLPVLFYTRRVSGIPLVLGLGIPHPSVARRAGYRPCCVPPCCFTKCMFWSESCKSYVCYYTFSEGRPRGTDRTTRYSTSRPQAQHLAPSLLALPFLEPWRRNACRPMQRPPRWTYPRSTWTVWSCKLTTWTSPWTSSQRRSPAW